MLRRGFAVSGGFSQVVDNQVTVLSESATAA
jgi:F0F1-type ATP synthase epsilon subunit